MVSPGQKMMTRTFADLDKQCEGAGKRLFARRYGENEPYQPDAVAMPRPKTEREEEDALIDKDDRFTAYMDRLGY